MKAVSRIILDPSVIEGKPVIRGTRISVDLVLELLASGWNESTILQEYPGLKRQDILACIRYAQEIVPIRAGVFAVRADCTAMFIAGCTVRTVFS